MTKDKKRKQAVRERMAVTGESYTVAARVIAEQQDNNSNTEESDDC